MQLPLPPPPTRPRPASAAMAALHTLDPRAEPVSPTPARTPPSAGSPASAPSGSPGRVRVTHHFRDDSRRENSVGHAEVGAQDATPRRRRVSVAWESPPHRVLVAATPHSARARAALGKLGRHLQDAHGISVLVESALLDSAPPGAEVVRTRDSDGAVVDDVHLVVCLGGDGLMLHVVSRLFPRSVPPVVPFNMGSLGFLTPFEFADFRTHFAQILSGRGTNVCMRMRLKCEVDRAPVPRDGTRSPCFRNFEENMLLEEEIADAITPNAEYHVLNEIVIDRGPAPYLSNLEVFCDDCPVTRVQADGLIVATPTGSTAYNLSAGGSMVHPGVPGILFTPICPHSLSFRPVIFPDFVTLQIKVPDDARASAWVSFDGRHRMELMRGDRVVLSVSEYYVPTFSKLDATRDWFRSISSCLHWNERLAQGSLDSTETATENNDSDADCE